LAAGCSRGDHAGPLTGSQQAGLRGLDFQRGLLGIYTLYDQWKKTKDRTGEKRKEEIKAELKMSENKKK
jgi:hypothetical protein